MDMWESSGMWPFSCFAFTRETSSLPGWCIDLFNSITFLGIYDSYNFLAVQGFVHKCFFFSRDSCVLLWYTLKWFLFDSLTENVH